MTAVLLLLAAGPAAAQTMIPYAAPACPATPSGVVNVPCALTLEYTLSATAQPFTSPAVMGVNAGHNNDTSWITYMKHLGVNGVRIFGLAASVPSTSGATTGLQSFVASGGGTWEKDINGNAITNYATFMTAVASLRTSFSWLPSATNTAFSNGASVRWQTFQTELNTLSSSGGPTGNSMAGQVSAVYGIGATPILVFWLACSTFAFTTLDVTNPNYWAERYELYKHTYMGAVWGYQHGVYKFEFWCARAVWGQQRRRHHTCSSVAARLITQSLAKRRVAGTSPTSAGALRARRA